MMAYPLTADPSEGGHVNTGWVGYAGALLGANGGAAIGGLAVGGVANLLIPSSSSRGGLEAVGDVLAGAFLILLFGLVGVVGGYVVGCVLLLRYLGAGLPAETAAWSMGGLLASLLLAMLVAGVTGFEDSGVLILLAPAIGRFGAVTSWRRRPVPTAPQPPPPDAATRLDVGDDPTEPDPDVTGPDVTGPDVTGSAGP